MIVQLPLRNYSLTSSGQLNASNAQSVGMKYGTHRHEHTEHSSSKVKARVKAKARVKPKATAKANLDIPIQKIRIMPTRMQPEPKRLNHSHHTENVGAYTALETENQANADSAQSTSKREWKTNT